MGQLLRWAIPTDSDVSYDYTYIYRATSQSGAYSEIANQVISNNEYFDLDGETSNWYKIRFFDSTETKWSNYSTELQGGTFYGYCSIKEVRTLTGLTETQISDSNVFSLIKYAMAQLNADIQVEHKDERLLYISLEKENDIDGSNTTFYTRNLLLGDKDNNGSVDTDDIEAYSLDSDGTRTSLTVSSIDDVELGKFTLASAPTEDKTYYINYFSTPLLAEPPHMLIRLACSYLTAALSYTRIDAAKCKRFRVGKISVMQQSDAFGTYMGKYRNVVDQISQTVLHKKESIDYV